MKRIVVGFDGGEEARDALRLGSSLAKATGAELTIAAAFGPALAGPGVDVQATGREFFHEVFVKAERELGRSDFDRRELRQVSAPRGLNQLAEHEDVDLIVVGSTQRGAVGRVVFGSVGERLLYGAPCAVAVAPRGYAGCEHIGLGIIGVAYDGGDESALALAYARDLVATLGGELRLITVLPERGPGTFPNPYIETDREAYGQAQRLAVVEIGDSAKVEATLEEGDPAAALARNGVDLDLLVIGSRGYGPVRRTLLGGVSAEVMRTSPCSVLVVPRGAAAPGAGS
jgi:nucleotide-binding universal stress UspA family protein